MLVCVLAFADRPQRRDKSCAVVSHARQDKYVTPPAFLVVSLHFFSLKRQMQEVYGWTKGTFVERSGV